jgi:sugar lactone lactonase YvrE
VTGFASGELLRLSPDGAEIGRVALPGVACTNVRFGGADMRDLYVTMVDPRAAAALAAGRMPEGQDSRLLKGRSPVAGAPMAKAGFALK